MRMQWWEWGNDDSVDDDNYDEDGDDVDAADLAGVAGVGSSDERAKWSDPSAVGAPDDED